MKKYIKEISSKFTNDKIFSTFTFFLFVYLIVLVFISYPDTIHFWGGWKLALIMRTIGSVFPVYFISYYFLDKYNKYCITRDKVNNPIYNNPERNPQIERPIITFGHISRADATDVEIVNLKKEKKTLEGLCVALRKELDDVKKVKKKTENEYNIEKEGKDSIGWLEI